MIPRPQAGTQRPPPPQRVSSTGPHRPLNRPALPSKLSNVSNVRSAAQHASASTVHARPQLPIIKQETVAVKPEAIDTDMDEEIHSGNEASSVSVKAYSATSHLADGQSPRPWETTTLPPPTPQQSQPVKSEPLPLPSRPSFLAEPVKRSSQPSSAVSRERRDPARRSSGLRAPAVATPLPRGKVADFFPWTGIAGAHPEDVMNELSVRSGGNDKGVGPGCPPSAAESNTARPSLWPTLKSKQGMHILSNLFCQVMDKRQQMGRCTAPSTFKPPPRVTLTDSKREAWLKDLANPDVPLRRLSRTIPHGIRGRVLLDHCITKDIPIARAIWLSKCVGANEIRAFKRKGVSGPSALAGEAKWIREWTICVEQFIEAVIGECGQPGWSKKMNYAIRLATYFFSEHLLDAEYYIDWLLSSLAAASTERLPIWVLLTQVYWKHLISQRKRGRKLAEAFITHALHLETLGLPSNAPLLARIQQLISILAIAHQGCLVMPKTWNEYATTFEHIASLDKFANAKAAMAHARKRNLRIIGSSRSATSSSQSHAKQATIDILDRVGLEGQVPSEVLPHTSYLLNGQPVLGVVLEWATSRHRQGLARVYLAARILRLWNITGADTDSLILDMLELSSSDPSIDTKPLHAIVALLARSGHFSVGKYLQWLISIGALSGIPAVSNDAHLLLELPTGHLQPHVLNLRRTILSRIGYGIQSEAQDVEGYKAYISTLFRAVSLSSPRSERHTPPPSPTGAVKLEVAQWLCDGLTAAREGTISTHVDDRIFKGSVHTFRIARETLEQFEDFLGLSAIIRAASGSTVEAQFLATIADTINMHADVFAAMGVLDELVHRLCMQQQDLRRKLPLDKAVLLALSSLVQRVPSAASFRQTIASDLQFCETQSSAAACSPASDSMVTAGGGVPESNEDINRVLASGNTMDEHLFMRMFGIIADRAIKTGFQGLTCTGAWFSQLRRFDPATFDQLVQSHISRLVGPSSTVRTFVQFMAALVGSGCIKIDLPFRIIERHLNVSKEPATINWLAHIALELMLPLKTMPTIEGSLELYKFQLEQKLFCECKADDLSNMLFSYLGSIPTGVEFAVDERMVSFLRHQVNSRGNISVDKCLGKIDSLSNGAPVQLVLDRLMNPTGTVSPAAMTTMSRVQRIIASANEVSLQSCKLALKVCFLSASLRSDDKDNLSNVFQEAIERDSSVWPELVTALDDQSIYGIHAWARDRATSLLSDFVSSAESSVKIEEIRRYLVAADITSLPAEAQGGQPQTFFSLNDHFSSICKLVDQIDPLDVVQASQRQRVAFGLDVLLQLTAKHFLTASETVVSSIEVATLTNTLCHLLIHQRLQNQRGILEYILDVLSIIVDDLSYESMGSIVRCLPAYARNDPRIKYLFGITFSPDAWLALASKVFAQQPAQPPQQAQASTPSSLPRPSHPLPPRPGGALQRTPSSGNNNTMTIPSQGGVLAQKPAPPTQASVAAPAPRANYEIKYNPFQIRRWEIMPDPTPNMGANDTSLSLGLFQARKVS